MKKSMIALTAVLLSLSASSFASNESGDNDAGNNDNDYNVSQTKSYQNHVDRVQSDKPVESDGSVFLY